MRIAALPSSATPVSSILSACAGPTSRGRRWVPPKCGIRPSLSWPIASRAERAATRRSVASASSSPSSATTPSRMPSVGLVSTAIDSTTRGAMRSTSGSNPAQKLPPAPRIASISASASSSTSSASSISLSAIAALRRLRAAGRSSVATTHPPARVTSTRPAPCAGRVRLGLRRFRALVTQLLAQDFAQRVLGQRVDELDRLGPLETGQPRAAELGDLGRGDILSRPLYNESLDRLSPLDRGHADYRCLLDRRMAHQDGFDLGGRDILAAADDHVVLAPGKENVTFLVDPSEVARRAPSFGQPRIVLAPRVALHDARSANEDFADLSVREQLAVVVAHRDLDVGQRPADRIEPLELELDRAGIALEAMVVRAEHGER